MTLYLGNDEVSQKVLLSTVGSNLPEITTETSGKILSNNGTELVWVDKPMGKVIGSFGYTLDNVAPEGTVFCDGSEYTQEEYPDFYQSLIDNKRKSVDYATFNSSVSTNGSCGFFGLESTVITLYAWEDRDYIIYTKSENPLVGDSIFDNVGNKRGTITVYDGGQYIEDVNFSSNISLLAPEPGVYTRSQSSDITINGEYTGKFKVPMLKDVYLKAGQEPVIFGGESLPNIKGIAALGGISGLSYTLACDNYSGCFYHIYDNEQGSYSITTKTEQKTGLALDASRSSKIYQNEAKVNPDYVAYKVYVVLATKKSETSSEIKDYEIYNTVPLLTPLFHPEEISDTNWLKSDGQWNPASVYETVYDELTSDYNLGTEQTDTIGDISITYRLTPKKRRICLVDQDTNVTNLFNATGIAWYYVIDNSNNQFKLPRSKYSFVGNRDNVGGYVAESLPNITGEFSATRAAGSDTVSGVFTQSENLINSAAGTGNYGRTYNFDASRVSEAYQNGVPVQQRAIEAYLYFKVGNTTVNAQLVNVANLTSSLSNKANTDLSNVNPVQAFKDTVINWQTPDYPEENIFNNNNIPWNTAFQLPCDCAVYCGATAGGTSSNSLLVSFSFDGQTFFPVANWYNLYIALYVGNFSKGMYIKATGGTESQKLAYTPLRGASQ